MGGEIKLYLDMDGNKKIKYDTIQWIANNLDFQIRKLAE